MIKMRTKTIIQSEKHPKKIKKPKNDDSTAVILRVSSGFSSIFSPINDGRTMDGKALNSPTLKINRFFAHDPNI